MATFLERVQNWDWGPFHDRLREIQQNPDRGYDLAQPPGAWVNEALKQQGVQRSAFWRYLADELGNFAGFGDPGERQVLYDILWALYGPQTTVQEENQAAAKNLLAKSWLSAALGLPMSGAVSVPIARTPTAAGEILQRALTGQGGLNNLTLQLIAYYEGAPGIVDDQIASFLALAVDAAAAAVYDEATRRVLRSLVYDAFNEYVRLRSEGKLDSSTNFVEYFLSAAAYWLNWVFPGLDPLEVLSFIEELERGSGADQTAQAPDAGLSPETTSQQLVQAESPETASVQGPVPADQGQAPASQPTNTVAQAPGGLNEILRSEEIVVTFDPRINQPRNRSSGMRAMRYDMGSGRVAMATASPDEVFSDITRYLDQGGPYPLLPDMPVDQAIVYYNSWRTQRGLSPLSPAETEALRSLYSVYRPRI